MNRKYDFRVTEDSYRKEQLKAWKKELPSTSILMPPPNITGSLHIGHTLNLVIQDFISRSLIVRGQKVYWISGFDHAGIATQSVLENSGLVLCKSVAEKLKFVLSEWYPQKRQKFIEQWKNLGLQLDYQQSNFTMDSLVQDKVRNYFISLYKDNLIYRGTRIVNWDSKLKTVLSDIETDSEEIESTLFYVDYLLVGGGKLTVATSRPETIFADVALFVNPDDNRYCEYIGRIAINPLTEQQIPILANKKILPKFGTGVLKCTPAHDFKDYEIARENNLPLTSCYEKDGILNAMAGPWQGRDFRTIKDEIINYLSEKNLFVKQEKYNGRRVFSRRSGETIEPIISLQWFLNLPLMIKKIEERNPNFLNEVELLPSNVRKKLEDWKVNTREWCISRQLWWGHQIPAWYNDKGEIFVGIDPPAGQWVKDQNVLDTWFSSSLWPLITTVKNNQFTPIEYLVTGSDLLFFWLFKMIIFAFYFYQEAPFLKVIIHGLIRDENGKKMSKSQGNGIEQETIISEYGVDSLRLFLLLNNTVGNDITFNFNKLKGCYFFIQKLWSISEFITKNSPEFQRVIYTSELSWFLSKEENSLLKLTENRLLSKLFEVKKIYEDQLANGIDTSQVVFNILNFAKEEISNLFIAFLKGIESSSSYAVLGYSFQQLLILLNPVIPFVSSYLYLKHTSSQLVKIDFDYHLEFSFPTERFVLLEFPSQVRKAVDSLYRSSKTSILTISFKLDLLNEWLSCIDLINQILEQIRKIMKIDITLLNSQQAKVTDGHWSGSIKLPPFGLLRFMVTKEENLGLIKNLESSEFYEQEIKRSRGLLENEGFVRKAPRKLVEAERRKLVNYCKQQKLLKKKCIV